MKRAALLGCLLALIATPSAHAEFGYLGQIAAGTGDGDGQFSEPWGIDADAAGNVYVADFGNNRIQKLDAGGNFLTKWGGFGSGNGQFARPFDVAADSVGNVYVAENPYNTTPGGNHRVQKFDSDGRFLLKWGSWGGADGQFAGLLGIATDPADHVYVVENNRVQKFDSNGTFLLKWGSPGFAPWQFRGLTGIAVSPTGTVYTLESENRRVQKFDGTGTPLGEFVVSQTDRPDCLLALEVDAANHVYVAGGCTGTDHLRRFAPDGTLSQVIGPCNGGYQGVAAHPSGNIYASFQAAASAQSGVVVLGEGGGPCPPPPPPPSGGGGGGDPGPGGSTGLGFSGAETVTINAGAQFTNDPAVELTITPPAATRTVRLSNDGGFHAAADRTLEPTGRYPWQLTQTGQERLPKTVYVRFTGPGGTSPLTFSDDIILDQTAPTISSASVEGDGATAAIAAKTRARRYTLRVTARDNASGVGHVQLATSRNRPGKLRAYKRKLTARAATAPRYVRVRDRAGNFSRWRRLKAAR